jgi:Sodium/hydrogen exchanger family
MEPVQLAAILSAAVLLASIVSVELGISVALVELAFGVGLGNVFNLNPNASWLVFVASFASVVLTFLAGTEVDPDDFRERFWASVTIGVTSFAGPFVVATLVGLGPLGWTTKASLIAGTALSTTSLAVVYAVLVETGLNTGSSWISCGNSVAAECRATCSPGRTRPRRSVVPKFGLVLPLARRCGQGAMQRFRPTQIRRDLRTRRRVGDGDLWGCLQRGGACWTAVQLHHVPSDQSGLPEDETTARRA